MPKAALSTRCTRPPQLNGAETDGKEGFGCLVLGVIGDMEQRRAHYLLAAVNVAQSSN